MSELRATLAAEMVAADRTARTITGRVVPFGHVGRTSLGPAMFAAGAVTAPDPLRRLKLLASHRLPGHPDPDAVGYATAAVSTAEGLEVTFAVPAGPGGDAALEAASNGLRDGLSVEVSDIAGARNRDGVLEVSASSLDAVALVAIPAFSPAYVTAVTASTPPEGSPMTETNSTPVALEAAEGSPPASTAPVATGSPSGEAVPALTATRPTGAAAIPVAARVAAPMDLRRVSALIAAANRGEVEGHVLYAALAPSNTSDVGGIVPPAYVAELTGLVSIGRPFVEAISHRPLPATGTTVNTPKWVALPTVDVQAAQFDPISSTKATIGLATVPVVTVAGGNELSLQAVDRSDPSAVESLLIALAELYARKTDALAVAAAVAADTVKTPSMGADAADLFVGLAGGLSPTGTPGGGLVLTVSWATYLEAFAGLKDADKPAWWDGSVTIGAPQESGGRVANVELIVDPLLSGNAAILCARNALTFWEDAASPARISAVNVGVLGYELAIYGYHAVSVPFPGAVSVADLAVAPTMANVQKAHEARLELEAGEAGTLEADSREADKARRK